MDVPHEDLAILRLQNELVSCIRLAIRIILKFANKPLSAATCLTKRREIALNILRKLWPISLALESDQPFEIVRQINNNVLAL